MAGSVQDKKLWFSDDQRRELRRILAGEDKAEWFIFWVEHMTCPAEQIRQHGSNFRHYKLKIEPKGEGKVYQEYKALSRVFRLSTQLYAALTKLEGDARERLSIPFSISMDAVDSIVRTLTANAGNALASSALKQGERQHFMFHDTLRVGQIARPFYECFPHLALSAKPGTKFNEVVAVIIGKEPGTAVERLISHVIDKEGMRRWPSRTQ